MPILEEGDEEDAGSIAPALLVPLIPTLPQVDDTDGGEQVFESIIQFAYLLVGLALRLAKFARSFERRYCSCSS